MASACDWVSLARSIYYSGPIDDIVSTSGSIVAARGRKWVGDSVWRLTGISRFGGVVGGVGLEDGRMCAANAERRALGPDMALDNLGKGSGREKLKVS